MDRTSVNIFMQMSQGKQGFYNRGDGKKTCIMSWTEITLFLIWQINNFSWDDIFFVYFRCRFLALSLIHPITGSSMTYLIFSCPEKAPIRMKMIMSSAKVDLFLQFFLYFPQLFGQRHLKLVEFYISIY